MPTFSADGRMLAYSVSRDESWHLAVLDLETGEQSERLELRGEYASSSSWSPDGARLAFDMASEDGNYDIYTVAPDGTDLQVLVDGTGDQRFAAWSPDGSALAYHETADGNTDIIVLPSGGEPRRLAVTPDAEAAPIWSPDGTRLTFYSNRTGSTEVFSVDVATGAVEQHTDHD